MTDKEYRTKFSKKRSRTITKLAKRFVSKGERYKDNLTGLTYMRENGIVVCGYNNF